MSKPVIGKIETTVFVRPDPENIEKAVKVVIKKNEGALRALEDDFTLAYCAKCGQMTNHRDLNKIVEDKVNKEVNASLEQFADRLKMHFGKYAPESDMINGAIDYLLKEEIK